MTPGDISGIVIGCLLIACAIIICVFFILGYVTFKNALRRPKNSAPAYSESFLSLMGPDFKEFAEFQKTAARAAKELPAEDAETTSDDGLTLRGKFIPASPESTKTVLFLHGYRSTGFNDFGALIGFYHLSDYNVLLPDMRASGFSEGTYTGFSVLDAKDAIKWIGYLDNRVPDGTIVIHGLSMGAATAMNVSAHASLPLNVKCVISDCGFSSPAEILKYQIKQLYKLSPFPIFDIAELFCRRIARYDMKKVTPLKSVADSSVPIFFIHGEKDLLVPTYMCEACYAACTAPKEKWIVEDAGHAQSYFKERAAYEQKVIEFITKYN